jgi:uncharacterized Tic20 family protein
MSDENNPPSSESVEKILPANPVPLQQLGAGDERTWGLLAHLSVLLNLVTGFTGPIGAFIIYLVYKDRSRFVAYHAMQSMIFQLIWWYGGGLLIGLMWSIVGALSAVIIGIVLIPFALIGTFLFFDRDFSLPAPAVGRRNLRRRWRCSGQPGKGFQVLACR